MHQREQNNHHIYHQANTISHIHEKYQQQNGGTGIGGGAVFNNYTPPLPPLRNGEVPMTGTLKAAAITHTLQHNPIPPALPIRNGMATMGPQRTSTNNNNSSNGGPCREGTEMTVANGRRTLSGRHYH